VAPKSFKTTTIYKGVVPFIIMQIIVLLLVILFPQHLLLY
jgi:TRAP-type mannitol/chloroaromatic compound transport system permease large subunit